eukprot:2949950-Lingulodinium_polyedra.AAC.1
MPRNLKRSNAIQQTPKQCVPTFYAAQIAVEPPRLFGTIGVFVGGFGLSSPMVKNGSLPRAPPTTILAGQL